MSLPSKCGMLAIGENRFNAKMTSPIPSVPAWSGPPGGERTKTLTPVLKLSFPLLKAGTGSLTAQRPVQEQAVCTLKASGDRRQHPTPSRVAEEQGLLVQGRTDKIAIPLVSL